MRPVLCLITDRRREGDRWREGLTARVAAAARAGIDLVQVRERDLDARALADLVERCVTAVRGTRARVLVNDRADIALAAGAHGVHLRGDSMPAARVRRIVPAGFLIGRSVHDADEARRVEQEGGLDYLLFGTVFETASKPGVAAAGVDALAAVARASRLPVLAVGGITLQTLSRLRDAGAAGAAAIGLFAAPPPDRLQVVVPQASKVFDTPGAVP